MVKFRLWGASLRGRVMVLLGAALLFSLASAQEGADLTSVAANFQSTAIAYVSTLSGVTVTVLGAYLGWTLLKKFGKRMASAA